MNITKSDYKVLISIYNGDALNELKSATIKNIIDISSYSDSKIRKTIRKFKKLGYIEEGAWLGNSKTYFVTSKGIKKINQLVKGGSN